MYQDALRLVLENKYDEAKVKLQETVAELESVLQKKETVYHLFVL
jgi:TolA-binding protein